MNDILDLPGWTVLAKRLDGTEYEPEAEYAVQPTVCPKCGSMGKPYKHGTKNTTYRDSPIRGKTTRILAWLSQERRDKLSRLGGAQWIRDRIDKAKER